jgi:transcription antitermination factor NusG
MFAWHVATTKPFSELIAERHLDQQGFQPFSPRCLVSRISKNRRITVEKPYISGYIFINFDPELDNWQAINHTRGIATLILAGPERPAIVKQDAMDVLIDRCSGGNIVAPEIVDHHLAKLIPVGATVRITTGPLDGYSGPVRWSHNHRVAVLLKFLGISREVDIPAKAVEVVHAAAARG